MGGGGIFPGPDKAADNCVGASRPVVVGDVASVHAETNRRSATAKSENRFMRRAIDGKLTQVVSVGGAKLNNVGGDSNFAMRTS